MNKLKNFIALYFNLSKKEANGFIILCILMLAIIFIPSIYHSFLSPQQELLQSDKQTLDSLIVLIENKKSYNPAIPERNKMKKEAITYTTFNPNSNSEDELTRAGVPKFIAKRIIKFRSKGGKFKIKKDFKKIYGLTESDFEKLYPYIELPEDINIAPNQSERKFYSKEFVSKNNSRQIFDLNTADSIQLIALRGIGPAFASRIIKYRKKLGGFISKGQLKEVYGIDSIALSEMNMYTVIDKNFIPAKININTSTISLLSSHPYIGNKIAYLVVNYHKQHGNYTSLEQLKNIKPITEENYLKMLPYLSLE